MLDPQPGERILDLGCGDGALTARIAQTGAAVVGVDASADMVSAACARGIDARLGQGQSLAFQAEFDAVFSNAALHWMTDPDAVIAGAAQALMPGGRFVAEFGGHGNVAALRTALVAALAIEAGVETDLRDIWYFPTVEEHAARLQAGGFAVQAIESFARPTAVTAGAEAWFATLAAPALALAADAARAAVLARAAELAAPALRDAGGRWTADYVRLRFIASVEGR